MQSAPSLHRERRSSFPVPAFLVPVLLLLVAPAANAQWITQANTLKAGWNSVYLHVDASYTNVTALIGPSDIEEVWLWTYDLPPGLSLATPPNPSPDSRWIKWTRAQGTNSVLKTLPGNVALLVKVTSTAPSLIWNVKGRPAAPDHRWSLNGLNFVGFPTASPNPSFEAFLEPDAQALDWKQSAEIFRYQGGHLGVTNPIAVTAPLQRSVPVVREQAYWIRAGEPTNQIFNRYFGPFQVTGGGSTGIHFEEAQSQARLLLKNMTRSDLTVTLEEVLSEAPPTGPIPVELPLLLRGPVNTSTLTYGYANLAQNPTQWTLAASGLPGSEIEIVLGIDRLRMTGVAGEGFAAVLRFTDSLGLSRVDIGATATASSRAGLWVGNAVVDQVGHDLKHYAKATNASDFQQRTNQLAQVPGKSGLRYEWDQVTGHILVYGTNANGTVSQGSYLQDGPIQVAPDKVARPFPLRLIIHHDGLTARLMQRAYLGQDAHSNLVVATKQSALSPANLASARRISAVHLPTSNDNLPWDFTGGMEDGETLTVTNLLSFDDHSSNPFLHTYHPDHDNLDDKFERKLPSGRESYDLRRIIRLTFTAPGDDFESRTRGGARLTGNYAEAVSVLGQDSAVLKTFNVLGSFSLTRITDTATLTTQ